VAPTLQSSDTMSGNCSGRALVRTPAAQTDGATSEGKNQQSRRRQARVMNMLIPWRRLAGLWTRARAAALARSPFAVRWTLAQSLATLRLRGDEVFRALLFTHLSLALRDRPLAEQVQTARQAAVEFHFAMIDRYRCWAMDAASLRDAVRLEGAEHLAPLWGTKPVVLLCPHFLGLEAAAQRLALDGPGMTLYQPSTDPHLESLRNAARRRFNDQLLMPLGTPLHRLARELRRGRLLFLLPDLDVGGGAAAVFAPWFGWPASTVRTPAWCARRLGATLLPTSVQHVGKGRYIVRIEPPMPPLPDDEAEAAAQINACLERLILRAPGHYWWTHPRFLTQPPGQPMLYDAALRAKLQTPAKPAQSRWLQSSNSVQRQENPP
jgi:KDO2-lipid IV(A) lauroyltransferase